MDLKSALYEKGSHDEKKRLPKDLSDIKELDAVEKKQAKRILKSLNNSWYCC
jgi:hypothetical protein